METIAAYMAANPSVGTFLSNPTMEDKAKKDIITKLGKEADFHPFTANWPSSTRTMSGDSMGK